MKNIHLVHDDRDSFDGSLTNYIDDFDPLESIPFDRVQMAGMQVIPPLIAALETRNLRPMIGHKLATVAKLHGSSRPTITATTRALRRPIRWCWR
jgi:hypothetical protein